MTATALTRFNPDTADFDTALNVFIDKLTRAIHDKFDLRYPNLDKPEVTTSRGRKYVKVIVSRGSSRHVHSFIRIEDGAVLKAASWKAPAKHARGTIYSDTFDGYGVNTIGAHYLR